VIGNEFLDQVTIAPGLVIHNQSIGVATSSDGFEGGTIQFHVMSWFLKLILHTVDGILGYHQLLECIINAYIPPALVPLFLVSVPTAVFQKNKLTR
jgi:hypothetical protein